MRRLSRNRPGLRLSPKRNKSDARPRVAPDPVQAGPSGGVTMISTDPIRLYLQDIGRVDLLTQEEELTLARLVQRREQLLRQRPDGPGDPYPALWARRCNLAPASLRRELHRGRRAKERMIQANLRLVVAVAKKYQRRGMELLDLVQEGTLGLRAD